MKVWKDVPAGEDAARDLAGRLKIPYPVAFILAGRGLTDPELAGRFLKPRLSDLSDPFKLPDMREAVDRILRAVHERQVIAVYGDYDADGVTATALLVDVLERLGGRVSPFLPHRLEEGYGLSDEGLERCLRTCQPTLIITVDCGTNSDETVKRARDAGVDVVVTDHHELSDHPAHAAALVNPKRSGIPETEHLAGVGVAFKLCHALLKARNEAGASGQESIDLRDYLDLVAVGTIADVVPLAGENRILVRQGLQRIAKSRSTGLRALVETAGLTQDIDGYHVGFVIAPRLNAVGRLSSAQGALELLTTKDSDRALRLAHELEDANEQRRSIENRIREEAEEELEHASSRDPAFGIVVGRRGWQAGTVGLVASRLCARHHRPALVVAFDESGRGKGSGRSIDEVDLVRVLTACGDLLVKYGGHKMAAGFEVEESKFDALKKRFNDLCAELLKGRDLRPVQEVDGWIRLGDVDASLFDGLQQLQPFGMGNKTPVFGVRNVRVMGTPRIVGTRHLKMIVASGGTQMEAIGFSMGETHVPEGEVDILFQVQQNAYKGRCSLQLSLKDIRASSQAHGGETRGVLPTS